MRLIGIILVFCIINLPIVDAVPVVEVFVNGQKTSDDIIPGDIMTASENGEIELIVWNIDQDDPSHIIAATERAEDLNAQYEDVFIQGVLWNKSEQYLPSDLESINIEMEVKQNDDGSLILDAHIKLENDLDQTIVVQWLLLKNSTPISNHPIGPTESNLVSYHAWDSNINRTKGADNQWNHQIDVETLQSWNINNEDLTAVISLVSLESKQIHGSGSSKIIFSPIEENGKNMALSIILIFSGIMGSALVIQSEKRRQQDMPIIRPLAKNKTKNGEESEDYYIEITTGKAKIREITINGNGFWRCSNNEIPQEMPPGTKKEIKVRQITKGKDGPCTIRLEVDGHERWVLDILFPISK